MGDLPGADHAALIEDVHPAFIAAIAAFIARPGKCTMRRMARTSRVENDCGAPSRGSSRMRSAPNGCPARGAGRQRAPERPSFDCSYSARAAGPLSERRGPAGRLLRAGIARRSAAAAFGHY